MSHEGQECGSSARSLLHCMFLSRWFDNSIPNESVMTSVGQLLDAIKAWATPAKQERTRSWHAQCRPCVSCSQQKFCKVWVTRAQPASVTHPRVIRHQARDSSFSVRRPCRKYYTLWYLWYNTPYDNLHHQRLTLLRHRFRTMDVILAS